MKVFINGLNLDGSASEDTLINPPLYNVVTQPSEKHKGAAQSNY